MRNETEGITRLQLLKVVVNNGVLGSIAIP
jgi:hypothetical protein